MQIHKSVLIIIIVVLCLGSYFNTLFADFVWDDNIFVVPNPYMKSFRFLPKFFVHDFWKITTKTVLSEYYRPLLAASFMLDYTIWHNNPFGYHLTNVIFHILASILVFLLVELLSINTLLAFASALLFSVHPIHTEVVSFISGRVDSVPLVFFLLSLVLFLKYAFKKKAFLYLLSLFCFSLSLLTKEMAVTLPLVVICVDYLFISQRNIKSIIKNFLRFHLGFFVILGVYLVIRSYLLGLHFILEENVSHVRNFLIGTNPHWRIFTVIKILTFYLRLLFFPYGLNADYLFPPANSLLEPVVLIGLALLSFFVFIVIKNVKRYPILSFSILWFFVTILPVSNIFPQGNIFSERFIYTPSVGFCISIAFLFSWLLKKDIKTHYFNWKVSLYIVLFLFIMAMGRVTHERNKVWENDFALWFDTTKKSPNSPAAHSNLAYAYINMGLFDKAIKESNIAIEIDSSHYQQFYILGHTYLRKGLIDEAIKVFKLSIERFPDAGEVYHSLSTAYGMKGQCKEAIEVGLIALKKNPYLDEARYNLALNYKNIGLIDEAINAYEEYLKTNPSYPGVHVDIGQLYYEKGNYQKAKEHWLTALKVSKDYQPAKDALRLMGD